MQIFFFKSLDPDLELINSDSDSDPTLKGSNPTGYGFTTLRKVLCSCCCSTGPTIKI